MEGVVHEDWKTLEVEQLSEKRRLHVGTTGETPSGQVLEIIQIIGSRQMVVGAMGEDGANNVTCGRQLKNCVEEAMRKGLRRSGLTGEETGKPGCEHQREKCVLDTEETP